MTTETKILTEEQIDELCFLTPSNQTRRAANDRDMARAIEQSVLQSPEVRAMRKDAERLNLLRDGSLDLRCFNVPTGGDDCEIHWRVIEHHMAEPREREIGRSYSDDPREAIDAAMQEQKT